MPAAPRAANPAPKLRQGVWDFLPISQHLTLPGVEAAARVGKYAGDLQAAGRDTSGRLVGIDRVDFPKVAFFRPDFASEPLVALMNRLASDPCGPAGG